MKRFPAWLKLTLIALLPRLFFLGHEPLWFDEIFSAWTVSPASDFWRAVIGDNHPPLWLLIQKLNVSLLGISEFTLRLPAMVCGVGCVLLIWQIACHYFDQKTAWTAGLIAALLPSALYFSQDSRMYSGLALFVLTFLYAGITNRRRLFIMAGIAAVYTHNTGVLYVLCIGGALIIARRNWRDLAACIIIALAWLPWASVVIRQLHSVQAGYWPAPITPGGIISPLLQTTVGWRLSPALQVPVYVVAIGLTILSLINCRPWLYKSTALPVLALIAGVPISLLGFSLLISNIWIFRALFPIGFGIVLLWSYTLNHLSRDNQAVARPLFVFALACGVLAHYSPFQGRPDASGWMDTIRAEWQPGQVVYYLNATDAINYQWYMREYEYAVRPTEPSLLAITADCRVAFGLHEAALDNLSAQTIYVLFNHMPYTPQEEADYLDHLLATYPHTQLAERDGSVIYKVRLYD